MFQRLARIVPLTFLALLPIAALASKCDLAAADANSSGCASTKDSAGSTLTYCRYAADGFRDCATEAVGPMRQWLFELEGNRRFDAAPKYDELGLVSDAKDQYLRSLAVSRRVMNSTESSAQAKYQASVWAGYASDRLKEFGL